MKQFIYKTIIAVIAIVLVYELTIAKQIKEFTSQSEILLTKEGRKDGVDKIRDEIKKAVKKCNLAENDEGIAMFDLQDVERTGSKSIDYTTLVVH